MRFSVLAVTLVLWISMAPGVAAQSPDPQQVVDAFELARGAGDIDGALAQLADTAVITIQNQHSSRSFSGAVQLRSYLQTVGTHFQTAMRSRPMVQGSTVTWTERDQYGTQAVDATIVAVVSAGHIVALSYRTSDPVGSPSGPADATSRQAIELPSMAWPAVLAVLGLGLLALVFGRPRRKASRSQLDGRLLVALRRDRACEVRDTERRAA
ncbi:MAG: hypothetical protein JO020_05150 [Chloroflexi bacterium]|nr:hypothetical protein [Chloroflexota bacterium]